MKYVINMVDSLGKTKIKIVNALDIKEAESKAKNHYPLHKIERITKDENSIYYYAKMKKKDIN
jgi:hypothetical protein